MITIGGVNMDAVWQAMRRKGVSSVSNVVVIDGKITIDGLPLDEWEKGPVPEGSTNEGRYEIHIHGDVDKISDAKNATIHVAGNCRFISTGSGDITCNKVEGNISTGSGDVSCNGDICGNVSTSSGDVQCRGEISGHVNTVSGNIYE